MRKVWLWLDKHMEESLLVLMFGTMSVIIVLQVFMRYALNSSLAWSEEMARYLFIWLTYIGISYGVREGRHIRVTAISLVLSKRLNKICMILSNVVFLIFAIIVTYVAYHVAMKTMKYGQISASLGMPMFLVYFASPIGLGLTCFRLVQRIVYQWKSEDGNDTAVESVVTTPETQP